MTYDGTYLGLRFLLEMLGGKKQASHSLHCALCTTSATGRKPVLAPYQSSTVCLFWCVFGTLFYALLL